MFKRILTTTAVLILGLTSGMYVNAQRPDPASAILFEIGGNGLEKPSYIFGTIHLICPADMIPIEKLAGYLDNSDQLLLELDFDDPAELQAMMALLTPKKDDRLAVNLSRRQFEKIDKMTRSILGKPYFELQNLDPIILQSMLLTSPKGIGCNPPGSYEVTLMQTAMRTKKPIAGLETVADQMATLKKTPPSKQAVAIYEIAKDPEKYFAQFRDLIKTYKTQDSNALYEFVQKQMKADPAMQITMLDERNKAWIPKIETAVSEKPTFIAVGAAHLGGENGVLKLLEKQGFTLKPIRL